MTIRHFRIFLAVASTESITRASKELYLAQPTVSVAIRELEAHYGVRLFDRMNQRLKITPEGRALQTYASHLISLYDEIEASFQNPDVRGTLRVGSSVNAGIYFIPSLVRAFQDRFPDLRLQVRVTNTEVIEKLLLDNELDLAVVGGPLHSPFLTERKLFDERHAAVCAPDHPLAGKTVSLQEFAKKPLLFRERTSSAYEVLRAAMSQAGLSAAPAWESASQEALIEAAALGLGVAILPEKLAAHHVAARRLAVITIQDFVLKTPVRAVCHKSKFVSPVMERFLEMAVKMGKTLPQQ